MDLEIAGLEGQSTSDGDKSGWAGRTTLALRIADLSGQYTPVKVGVT